MQLPSKALFAFNANIDYVKAPSEQDLAAIEEFSPPLSAQLSECFAYGVQKEVAIDSRACNFFISKIKFGRKIVGGQAGNAAAQAAALGVSSYLHSNFANTSLASLFSQKENIFFPSEKGFVSADNLNSNTASAHHFVFESIESNTRFIAGYDPFPIHLEDNFCFNITQQLSGMEKAFLGGFHLVKTPDRLRKLIAEIRRWKSLNPSMKLFAELGQFQSPEVMEAARSELFPFVDMVGLNENELAAFGCGLEELGQNSKAILFHSAAEQRVYPSSSLDAPALEFARKCASFKAEFGRFATLKELQGYGAKTIEEPVQTVGLGDTLSAAYFLAMG